MLTRIITEGATKIEVPVPEPGSTYPPSSTAVFYNPEMEMNRDITVAVVAAFADRYREESGETPLTYLDALSATGIRGLRIACETGLKVTLCDWSAEAHELAKKNISLNGLDSLASAIKRNSNVVMLDQNFDIIDLDPFGTPVPYLDAACRSTRRLLMVTATDTAPLCGAHKKAGIRTYGAVPLKTEYYKEMALRILLGKIARTLAAVDKSMTPLLSFTAVHYVRTYLKIEKGIKLADECIGKTGFISHCFNCGTRIWEYGLAPHIETKCAICGSGTQLAGPLWLGNLHTREFCDSVIPELEKRNFAKKKSEIAIVAACREELDIPTYYDLHKICESMRISPPPTRDFINYIKLRGYEASRTHFSGISFKTNADIPEIKRCISELQGLKEV